MAVKHYPPQQYFFKMLRVMDYSSLCSFYEIYSDKSNSDDDFSTEDRRA